MKQPPRRLVQVGAVQGYAHENVVRLEWAVPPQTSLDARVAHGRHQGTECMQRYLAIALQSRQCYTPVPTM
jgi:hypothetical protein